MTETSPPRKAGPLRTFWSFDHSSFGFDSSFVIRISSLSRVVFFVDLFEPVGIDMCVDLGGGDVGMAEECLDDAEVGSAGEEVCGEGVAERVRMDGSHAGLKGEASGKLLEDDAGHGPAGTCEEYFVCGGFGVDGFDADEFGAKRVEVVIDRINGVFAERDFALLLAFANNADKTLIEVQVFERQVREFRGSQARCVKEFDDGLVTLGETVGFFRTGGGEEGVDLLAAEGVGQLLPTVRSLQQLGRIGGDISAALGEAVEHFERRDVPLDGSGGEVSFELEKSKEPGDGCDIDGGNGDVGSLAEGDKVAEVA